MHFQVLSHFQMMRSDAIMSRLSLTLCFFCIIAYISGQKQPLMKKYIEILLHIIIWIFIFDELAFQVEKHSWFIGGYKNAAGFVNTNSYLWVWYILATVFKAAFFYINVYRIFSKYANTYKPSRSIEPLTLNLLVCGFFEFLAFYIAFSGLPVSSNIKLEWDYRIFIAQIIPYAFLLLLSYGYWAARQWLLHRKKLDKTTAELALLKTQINPHFLFNTLNNLFSMAIEKQAHELAQSIAQLTGLMRYTIYESNGAYVPLVKEVEYIENYISLQRLRFTEAEVPVRFTIQGDLRSVQIAPMLLINFVENAFKHGVSLKKESFIDINLAVTESQIHFTVVNTIHRQNAQASVKHSGFGQENTRKLLRLQYPDRHSLEMKEENNLHKVSLVIQLHKQKIEVVT